MCSIKKLKQIWQKTAEPHFQNSEMANSIFSKLVEMHTEKHRKYHNLTHLQDLFGKWNQLDLNFVKPVEISFSIWFHDCVYNSLKSNNEAKSADFAVEILSEHSNLTKTQIDSIEKLILATAKHIPNPTEEPDCSLFLDLDLSILGAEKSRYQEYMQEIRSEYKHVPSFLYRRGRKKILQAFAQKPTIFYTETFRELYETQARENLAFEIEELS
ncbi:MAG: putative metal-dependent HD superfamily phosphohydrolase [Flammeovirgaceae bacterium]|jgi:predicted metal-dependent HD superfamily phosphohydrolase